MPVIRLIRAFAAVFCFGAVLCSSPVARAVETCPVAVEGDVDCSGDIGMSDILTMTTYVFRGENHICPVPLVADLNLDGVVNAADVIRMVDYLFRDGPAPSGICTAHFGNSDLAAQAEMIALVYGGQLTAPTELQWHVYEDLQSILSDVSGPTRFDFTSPWPPSRILLRVNQATGHKMSTGAYRAWDSLNANCEMIGLNVQSDFEGVELRFAGFKNARVLSQLYGQLPDVDRALYPFQIAVAWSGPRLYALVSRQGIVYVFKDLAACDSSGCRFRYWYYTSGASGVERMGYWDGVPPEPAWLPIAQAAEEAYWRQ